MKNKEEILKEINNEIPTFHFSLKNRVRFDEVDSFNVVHNLKYFYWLEWARLEYIRALGVNFKADTFINDYLFMTVHAEIDYFNAAVFDDEYEVLTKVTNIKNSSLSFRNIIRKADGTILILASAVIVRMDPKNKEPLTIEDDLRKKIEQYEKRQF
jgi:acyl-CoA thioester hydrolase